MYTRLAAACYRNSLVILNAVKKWQFLHDCVKFTITFCGTGQHSFFFAKKVLVAEHVTWSPCDWEWKESLIVRRRSIFCSDVVCNLAATEALTGHWGIPRSRCEVGRRGGGSLPPLPGKWRGSPAPPFPTSMLIHSNLWMISLKMAPIDICNPRLIYGPHIDPDRFIHYF